jgi:hypothetical protein
VTVTWLRCGRARFSAAPDDPGSASHSERAEWNEETDVAFRMSPLTLLVGPAAAEASGSFGFFLSEVNQVFTEEI